MFDELRGNSYLFGANAPFIEALYDHYLEDPSSVEPRWRSYFDELQKLDDGAPDVSHSRHESQDTDCEIELLVMKSPRKRFTR